MSSCCRDVAGETLIFTCAGAAHCGQVANRAAVVLTQEGVGQIFCLAAVAAGIPDKSMRARRAATRIAIDGCEDHCTRKTLEGAGMAAEVHVELTALGIGKKPERSSLIDDARRAATQVKTLLEARRS